MDGYVGGWMDGYLGFGRKVRTITGQWKEKRTRWERSLGLEGSSEEVGLRGSGRGRGRAFLGTFTYLKPVQPQEVGMMTCMLKMSKLRPSKV